MNNVSTHRLDVRSIGRVRVITLDRAPKRNALDENAVIQLAQAWHDFAASDDKVAILRAEGPVFTAGFDMNAPPAQFWRAIPGIGIELEKPVIAAIDGPVIAAGVSLVAFCDLCVASDRSYFVYPEARLGSAAGLIASVVPRIPHKVAMELMLLGRPVSAARAYDVGFVNQVCTVGQETGLALQMAHEMAASSLTVLRFLKSLSTQTLMRSPVEDMAVAQMAVDAVATSVDALEGTLARREKRPARFKGR
ncbi:enoyl-CoA hydratase/isomerase family protein [Alcaligenes sp. 13f]|uniref:enoyl-CoA hydratase/isomerase family protein n=1 Tax=Alcaligenes sp. 13f TaxID=2841924 RepID=UPI001CF6779A|nr:enoyl-CoA hydratase/isomerase family protein [Alcaligenes sp. 13f]MCB4321520.1 enoyl-CoA hydratase/isomerase family protein [Alcaligenes sp. 13f]